MYDLIIGSGGGGGKGGGNGIQEEPNSLQADSTARIIDLLSEGEIVGLVGGQKGIFFNLTPIVNESGAANFQGITYDVRNGTPSQTYMPEFSAAENEVSVGQIPRYENPVSRTITDANVDAVRVTLAWNALYFESFTDGDIRGAQVHIQIWVSVGDGDFVLYLDDEVSGKTTSQYERSYRLNLPPGGPSWTVQVRRLDPDDGNVSGANEVQFTDFTWSSFTEITDGHFEYPNSAYVGLRLDAYQFGSSIPARTYLLDGIKLQVPSNFTPTYDSAGNYFGGTYAGVWDGTFQTLDTVCSNPAWVLWDVLTNPRYGLGSVLGADNVDKWGLYQIAVWCDQLVPDGFGGQEPRYRFNASISTSDDAYKIIQGIASCFHGMVYWSSGTVFVVADMPCDITSVVTPANVIDGLFNYEGSAKKARHNACIVSWQDPQQFYQQTTEIYEYQASISKDAYKLTQITGFGCTSRGQAHRLARWTIDTEQNQTETVTYQASWDHADVAPGNVIAIADPAYAGVRYGGRTIAVGTGITIDAPVALSLGQTYSLMASLPDGSVASQPISTSLPYTGTSLSFASITSGLSATLSGTSSITTPFTVESVSAGPTAGTLTITVSITLPLGDGTGNILNVTLSDGQVALLPISQISSGETATFVAQTVLCTKPGFVWIINGSDVAPRQFRVIGVSEQTPGIFQVTALFHDPNKYARIEDNIAFDPPSYSKFNTDTPAPPTNISAQESIYYVNGLPQNRMTISWTPSTDPRVNRYQVMMLSPDTSWTVLPFTNQASTDINQIQAGTYSFKVAAITSTNVYSTYDEIDNVVVTGKTTLPAGPETISASSGLYLEITVTWSASVSSDVAYYQLFEALTSLTDDDTIISGQIWQGAATSYTRTGLTTGDFRYYWVRSVDFAGNASALTGPAYGISSFEFDVSTIGKNAITNSMLAGGLQTTLTLINPSTFASIDAISPIVSTAASLYLEQQIREDADDALRQQIILLTQVHGDTSASVVEEAIARAAADEDLSELITNVTVTAENAAAAVNTEQAARITADDALSQRIDEVDATYGPNAAAIEAEAQARADGDSANAESINALVAGNPGPVFAAIQGTGPVTAAAASIWEERQVREDADTALASDIYQLNVTASGINASLEVESEVRAQADEALSFQLTQLNASLGQQSASLSTEIEARIDADGALSDRIDTQTAANATNAAAISTESQARADGDVATAKQINGLVVGAPGPIFGAINSLGPDVAAAAAVWEETQVREDANTALASRMYELSAQIDQSAASIVNEQAVRADAISSLAVELDSLTTQVGENTASINEESITRASADSALSFRTTQLESWVGDNGGSVTTSAVAVVNLHDALYGTGGSDTGLLGSLDSLSSELGGLNTTVTGTGGLTTQVSNLAGTVGGLNTAVNGPSGLADSVANLVGQMSGVVSEYTIKVQSTSDGKIALGGIGIIASGTTAQSEILLLASKLIVADVDNNGHLVEISPFFVENGNVYIQALYSGTISANQLTAGTISTSEIDIRPTTNGQGFNLYDTAGELVLNANGLAQGRATGMDVYLGEDFSFTYDGTERSIASVTMNVFSQRTSILAHVATDYTTSTEDVGGGEGGTTAVITVGQITANLYIDGTLVASVTMQSGTTVIIPYIYNGYTPGNHTFELRVIPSISTVYNIRRPYIQILDLVA